MLDKSQVKIEAEKFLDDMQKYSISGFDQKVEIQKLKLLICILDTLRGIELSIDNQD